MSVVNRFKSFAFRRKERVVTTWRFRLFVLACLALVPWVTRAFWIPEVAESLVCAEEIRPSDLILVDNSDQNYLAFEKATELRRSGIGRHVAVPVPTYSNSATVSGVAKGTVEVMARIAWLGEFEVLPVAEVEPITLNVAYQVRDYMAKRQLRSAIITVSAYRSRRTMLVYNAVMRDAGITVRCAPVFGRNNSMSWTDSWHSIESVTEQFLKLQYYRVSVLPFVARQQRPRS